MKKIQKLKIVFIGGILIGVPLIMYSVDWLSGSQTTCVFDAVGLQCFGCGILEALYKLKSGDIVGAFRANPLIFAWIGLGLISLINEIYYMGRRYYSKNPTKDTLVERVIKKLFKGINFEEV